MSSFMYIHGNNLMNKNWGIPIYIRIRMSYILNEISPGTHFSSSSTDVLPLFRGEIKTYHLGGTKAKEMSLFHLRGPERVTFFYVSSTSAVAWTRWIVFESDEDLRSFKAIWCPIKDQGNFRGSERAQPQTLWEIFRDNKWVADIL